MMKEFDFTLVLRVPELSEEQVDALFRAGCDDALVGAVDEIPYLDFTREAGCFAEALSTAMKQVEQVLGAGCVAHIEPDELVTLADISRRTGRTRESIRLLAAGKRGAGRFPLPMRGMTSRPRLWRWSEVIPWLADHGVQVQHGVQEQAKTIAMVNAALQLQCYQLHHGAKLVRELLGEYGADDIGTK